MTSIFKNRTLIIIGAGASKEICYPTGEELIAQIISNKMEIFKSYIIFRTMQELGEDALKQLNNNIIINSHNDKDINLHQYFPTSSYAQTKNLSLEFQMQKQFFARLQEFNPVSIDRFLSMHQEFEKIGKFAISYIILGREHASKDAMSLIGYKKKNQTDKYACGNWYKFLLDRITNCKEPEEINDNQIDIVNFNYDVSLEYFLRLTLYNNSFFNKKDKSGINIIDKFFSHTLRVHHVYGKVRDDNSITNNNFLNDYGSIFVREQISFENSTYNQKKIFNEQKKIIEQIGINSKIKVVLHGKANKSVSDKKYQTLIKNCESLYILGYGFLDENNDKISLIKKIVNKSSNLKNNKIFITNYGGSQIIDRKILHDICGNKKYIVSNRGTYEALCYDFSFYES